MLEYKVDGEGERDDDEGSGDQNGPYGRRITVGQQI